jgi:hypothetical protein
MMAPAQRGDDANGAIPSPLPSNVALDLHFGHIKSISLMNAYRSKCKPGMNFASRKDWDVLPVRTLTASQAARRLASLGVLLALGACASAPPPDPGMTVLPGKGKDLAAFQQDQLVCWRHAVAHTGYTNTAAFSAPGPTGGATGAAGGVRGAAGGATGLAGAAASPAGGASGPTGSVTGATGSVTGTMSGATGEAPVATGAAVANAPAGTQPFDEAGYLQCMASRGDTIQPASAGYAGSAYAYGSADPYGYAYGYPYGYGYGYPYPFDDGGFYGGFGWGGWGHGGWHRGGWGHGGWGHGGWGRGGFAHGGFGHGGFAHGGGGHGGGGFGGGHR